MTTTPQLSRLTIHSNADLFTVWSTLMGSGGISSRTLWLAFLDGGHRTLPLLLPIEDLPEQPDVSALAELAHVVGQVISSGDAASVLLLLARPGTVAMTAADRRWASALHAQVDGRLSQWPIHLATRNRIQVFAPEDLQFGE